MQKFRQKITSVKTAFSQQPLKLTMPDLSRFQRSFAEVRHEVVPPIRMDSWDAPSGLSENWTPDPEEEPMPSPNIPTASLEWFDMDELAPEQFLILTLKGAQYGVRRVDEEQMKLWSSRGGRYRRPVPFLGRLEHFGMIDTSPRTTEAPQKVDFYPGSIALVSDEIIAHIAMPYFKFDDDGKLQESEDVWIGSVQGINLGQI
jgi:hypothetical protein